MKILGIIPARGGSKGVPKKNIRSFAGKPLIGYTIESAINSQLDDIIVSTDDKLIADISISLGAQVPFVRPNEISSDKASSIDVCIHALNAMENINKYSYDAIMMLQPTAPFRTSDDINASIEILKENRLSDSVISVVNVLAHHPARMKYLDNGILIDPPFCELYENQNRQELTPMYIRNGAIYLTKRNTLINRSFKGVNCMAYVMPEIRSANIDTLKDFELAEWIYNKYIK
jgi:CMP-N,N'-diacetyllegionaminic acid synthase